MTTRRLVLAIAALLSGAALIPQDAAAQAGIYITPGLTAAEVYDDNVFSAPSNPPDSSVPGAADIEDREDDFITRFSPSLAVGYRSDPLTLVAEYSLDADIYASHSDLSDFPARQVVTGSLRYLPTKRLTLGLGASYRDTNTARDLNLSQLLTPESGSGIYATTNLDTQRLAAREYTLSPLIDYRLSRRLAASANYNLRSTSQSGSTNDSHIAGALMRWVVRPNHSVFGGYSLSVFNFDTSSSGGDPDVTSHTLPVGWRYQLERQIELSLQAGPRFSDGSTDIDAAARASYHLEKGLLSLAYLRRQTTSVGRNDVVTSDTLSTGITYDLTRRLAVAAGFTFSLDSLEESDANVYQTTVGASYAITEWLSLSLSHQFAYQEEHFDDRSSTQAAGRSHEEIYHNTVLLGLKATNTWRID